MIEENHINNKFFNYTRKNLSFIKLLQLYLKKIPKFVLNLSCNSNDGIH